MIRRMKWDIAGLLLGILCCIIFGSHHRVAFWAALSGIATGFFLFDVLKGQRP